MQQRRKKRRSDLRIAERWTAQLAETGFTPVVSAFLQHYAHLNPPLSAAEAMLVVHIVSYKWTAKAPYPSIKTIAHAMGCSDRYVRKLLEGLQVAKYVTRIERIGDTNEFDLSGLFAALEAKLPKAAPVDLFDNATADAIAEIHAKQMELQAKLASLTAARSVALSIVPATAAR